MRDTIRDRIKRRVRWCAAIGIGGWLILPLGAATSGGRLPPPLFVLGFVLFLGAMLALQYAIKCPRCSTKIGQEIGMRVGLSLWGKQPNFCPYCGVSFDEACSPTAGQLPPGHDQSPIK